MTLGKKSFRLRGGKVGSLFSEYILLRRPGIDVSKVTAGEMSSFFGNWTEELVADIRLFHSKNIIPTHVKNICVAGIRYWARDLPEHFNVNDVDRFYVKFTQFLSGVMLLNPNMVSIPGGYPFEKNVAGVHMRVRLVMEGNGRSFTFTQQYDSQSVVGSSSKKLAQEDVKRNIGNIPWLKEIKVNINKITPKVPHAETLWLVRHSQELVKYLLENEAFNKLQRINDVLLETQITQTPRLEIITSSTVCKEYCQRIFSALRLYLEKNNIHMPMVLYSDSSFNGEEEGYGAVHLVSSKGVVRQANVRCLTPHSQNTDLSSQYILSLDDKKTQDFARLSLIGGFALIELIKIGFHLYSDTSVNPVTYIPPDSMIIYAADLILIDPRSSTKSKCQARYMINILESMDMGVLLSWRMMYLEQLHWLLLAHLDDKYRERSHGYALASNMNVITPITEHDFSKYDEFFRAFFDFWQNPNTLYAFNLTELYEKMLRYFTRNCNTAMPLGSVVGPLSQGMIDAAQVYPPGYRKVILEGRATLIREELVEEDATEPHGFDDSDPDESSKNANILTP